MSPYSLLYWVIKHARKKIKKIQIVRYVYKMPKFHVSNTNLCIIFNNVALFISKKRSKRLFSTTYIFICMIPTNEHGWDEGWRTLSLIFDDWRWPKEWALKTFLNLLRKLKASTLRTMCSQELKDLCHSFLTLCCVFLNLH